jgi:hypothetical protein
MRAKIHRLTTAKNGNVDASDYGPEQVLDSEAKTGMRPISRRAYKKGGKVVAVSGADAKQNAGKKPRSGNKHLTIDALVNRNLKDANEAREGKKHVGGFKSGGRTKKQYGGMNGRPTEERDMMSDAERKLLFESAKKDPLTRPIPKAPPQEKPAEPVYRGKSVRIPVSDEVTPLRVRKSGGKAWEGSAKDEAQDKKLAKKHGMSMSAWEKSSMDKKHDTQHSTEGLKKGGRTGKSLGGVLKDVGKYGALGAAMGGNAPVMGGLAAMADHFLNKKKGSSDAAAGPAVAGKKSGGGLYANIHAKQERIAHGSKERIRKVGSKGAPTAEAFEKSARTAKAHGGFTSLDGEFQTQQKVTGRHAKMHGGSLSGLEMNKGGRAKRDDSNEIIRAAKKVAKKLPYQTGYEEGTALMGRSDDSYRKRRGEDLSRAKMMREEAPERIRDDAVRSVQKDMANLRSARSGMKDEGYEKGGRAARKSGGRAKKSGKTNINIVIATGKGQQGMQPDMPPPPGPQGVPIPMPSSPPQAGAPMPMPIPMPMGGPGAGPAPMPRKAGGRTYRSYKDMDAGAGSGLGRLEKTEIQKHKK